MRCPFFRPFLNFLHGKLQALAFFRQLIFDPYRGLGVHVADNNARGLQLLEALRQHPVAHSGDNVGQILKALGSA
ncbi:hypothetical protein D3C76_1728420 [compost metagenome]